MTVKISELPGAVAFDGSEEIPLVQAGVTVRSPLGTAASEDVTTSTTDTTANRLLKVGDGGLLGDVVPVADWNATPSTTHILGAASAVNEPFGYAAGIQFTRVDSPLRGWQLVADTSGVSGLKISARKSVNGNWSEGTWRELYHTGNLLGTVSQAAGVPTGAVIERGSNSNGEYVRFADGTQMAYHAAALDSTVTFQVFEAPIGFIAPAGTRRPVVTFTWIAMDVAITARRECLFEVSSNSSAAIRRSTANLPNTDVYISWFGRWFI